jgi:hypothetical protein
VGITPPKRARAPPPTRATPRPTHCSARYTMHACGANRGSRAPSPGPVPHTLCSKGGQRGQVPQTIGGCEIAAGRLTVAPFLGRRVVHCTQPAARGFSATHGPAGLEGLAPDSRPWCVCVRACVCVCACVCARDVHSCVIRSVACSNGYGWFGPHGRGCMRVWVPVACTGTAQHSS